jgi:hypothetical protein
VSPYHDHLSNKAADGGKLADKSRSGKSIILDYTEKKYQNYNQVDEPAYKFTDKKRMESNLNIESLA